MQMKAGKIQPSTVDKRSTKEGPYPDRGHVGCRGSERGRILSVSQLLVRPVIHIPSERELRVRNRRWKYFQIMFPLLYLGIIFDIVTTNMGIGQDGKEYEQNPFGSVLIGNLGWIGLFVFMSAVCAVCYLSLRIVYWRMSTRWSLALNIALTCLTLVRWLIVVLAIQYLQQPHH